MPRRNNEIRDKIANYISIKAKIKTLEAQLKLTEAELKEIMVNQEVNELQDGNFVARLVETTSRRFDTTKFKAEHPDVYEVYRKDVVSKSFQAFAEQ